MDPSRQKIFSRLVLGSFVLACVLWLAQLDFSQKITTNVLDLIPASEQSPEMKVVRNLASDVEARVVLFALSDPGSPNVAPVDAAGIFVGELRKSGVFSELSVMGDTSAQNALGRGIFEHRFEFLLPSWLAARHREFSNAGKTEGMFSPWLAERVARDLENFLGKPEATALQEVIPSDPLMLVPGLLDKAHLLMGGESAPGGQVLIWAQTKASPFTEEGQGPVITAVERARLSAQKSGAGINMRWTGVSRFAAASRQRIESELSLLNILSLVAVLGVSCIFVRRIYKLLHLIPVILISVLGAWTASTMVFERLHILVFVVGSLLSGVAIDYGFYIYMQPFLDPAEPYAAKLHRLLKPLLASCLTTVIGFSLLFFSDLPVIRQIGVFVAAGLLCALGSAMLYFAQLDRPYLEGRQFGAASRGEPGAGRILFLRILFGLALAIALIGPLRLNWKDDIHQLDVPALDLNANDEAVRGLFGQSGSRTIYLTYGTTIAEAREHLQTFVDHVSSSLPDASAGSLGMVLPTEKDWSNLDTRLNELAGFGGDLKLALEKHGFDASSFQPFFAAWDQWREQPARGNYAGVVDDLRATVSGPLALLMNTNGSPAWFLTVVENAKGLVPLAGSQTVGINQLQSLNGLFARYRWSALRLSLVGLSLVIASVFAIYPVRRGIRIALIPAGSCFFIFGVLGLLGQTLNLFHLLGAFLGVCLAHNYAIFSSDSVHGGVAPPVSIRLSALCTAASFGVLACSHIPVIHSLGMTVALIVVTALATVELEASGRWSR